MVRIGSPFDVLEELEGFVMHYGIQGVRCYDVEALGDEQAARDEDEKHTLHMKVFGQINK